MKKSIRVSLLAATLPMAASTSALANPPTIERVPIDGQFVDESCGFAVTIEAKGFLVHITWVDPDGTQRGIDAAPQAKWVLTNHDTDKTITVNIAGPDKFTVNPDGSFKFAGTGTWGWTANLDTGAPGLFLTEGRFVFELDSAGTLSFSRTGRMVDLCAELAP